MDPFLFVRLYVSLYYAVLSVPKGIVVTCSDRTDLLALLCVVLSCVLSLFQIEAE